MSLNCPRTGAPLREVEVDGITVEISEGCGGIWLSAHELAKFDEFHEAAGDALLDLVAEFETDVDTEPRLPSPMDSEIVMMRRRIGPGVDVTIDECPLTGGIWLDPGELEQTRLAYNQPGRIDELESKFVEAISASFLETPGAAFVEERKTSRWSGFLGWIGKSDRSSRDAA